LPAIRRRAAALMTAGFLLVSACTAADSDSSPDELASWSSIEADARGQEVSLWMWGGDSRGNAYVDDVLAPAAQRLGVTLDRVPVADTKEALNRILAERQAGRADGSVDLVWVNGDNFATGRQAGVWRCGWSSMLPNMRFTDPSDPLLAEDFGTDVDGCESPWHKAQFTLVYDAGRVPDPPASLDELVRWAEKNPGRFAYPAPPDFTGSAFLRQMLYSVSGGHENVPGRFDQDSYERLSPALWRRLRDLAPLLWRGGRTYPRDSVALDRLFAEGQVDMTMTYGPATLTELVEEGTFPQTTRVLRLDEGTVGNASFLAIPVTSSDHAGAMVVANLALSPEQQRLKADPRVWGQFTVLDERRLSSQDRRAFEALPQSSIVPPYSELAESADPELASGWVRALDEGWRRNVLTATR
jgi:putative spermidine/putrescine transport system substrate-binding protein